MPVKKLTAKLKENEFYCVRCKQRVICEKEDIYVKIYVNKKTNNDVPSLKCACDCGVPLTKFIKHSKTKEMINKYGK